MWANAYSFKTLGEFLASARKEQGITQAEMAKTLGFSPVTLSARMTQQDTDNFCMSLAGLQEKMGVMMTELSERISHLENVDIYLPLGDVPSTHILKPEDTQIYPGCAESEV